MASATTEKIFGADRNSKGRALSTYVLFCHEISRSGWSIGCTRTILYASLRSSLTNLHDGPMRRIMVPASSTEAYFSEQMSPVNSTKRLISKLRLLSLTDGKLVHSLKLLKRIVPNSSH